MNQAVNLSRGPCVENADEGVDNKLLTAIYIFQVHNIQTCAIHLQAIVMNRPRHDVK